jgi:hypothetical protein
MCDILLHANEHEGRRLYGRLSPAPRPPDGKGRLQTGGIPRPARRGADFTQWLTGLTIVLAVVTALLAIAEGDRRGRKPASRPFPLPRPAPQNAAPANVMRGVEP